MKKNKIYESLIEKSISSMLSAIEIYNKPDFKYREETFAILAVNAWELLFKAYIYKTNKFSNNSIYCYKPYINKNGSRSKKKKIIDRNRSGNPKSISIVEAIRRLDAKGELPVNLKENIEALIELRDNAIHFLNMDAISKQVQELGFACIKNYVAILQKWDKRHDLSSYNLYLMPLAYVDDKVVAESTLTKETLNFINLVKDKIGHGDKRDTDYDIAVKIELRFQRGNSFGAANVQYDKNGIPITISEEEMRSKYPLTYKEVTSKSHSRYIDFKQGKNFNAIMADIKTNPKLFYERRLDSQNPKSAKQGFYSTNIWQTLDKHYTKK